MSLFGSTKEEPRCSCRVSKWAFHLAHRHTDSKMHTIILICIIVLMLFFFLGHTCISGASISLFQAVSFRGPSLVDTLSPASPRVAKPTLLDQVSFPHLLKSLLYLCQGWVQVSGGDQ